MTASDEAPVFVPASVVSAVLDVPEAVAAIRELYGRRPAAGVASGRVVASAGAARLRALAAVAPGDVMGAKLHAQASDGNSGFLIALFNQSDGRLLALLDGREVTAARTAATSAFAVDVLAPAGPLDVGVLGSGMEARAHLRALAAARPLDAVRVYSPTAANRASFAAELGRELGISIEQLSDPRAVVDSSTTVVCAARSRGEVPVLDGAWLQPTALVVSIGSTVPDQRELDVTTLERATVVVADEPEEALASGDCIAAAAAGVDVAAKLVSLADAPGSYDGIAVFKSVGSALQDVAVADLVLRRARGHDDLISLPIQLTPKERRGGLSQG